MTRKYLIPLLFAAILTASTARAAIDLIAIGSVSGTYEDFAIETADPLESGVPGNRLGGIGSGLAYACGNTFIALPDRGPNAKAYNSNVDNTTSYITRFHTLSLSLAPSDPGSALAFTLTPMLTSTTLLSSPTPLVYGSGAGLGYQIDGVTPLGSGEPALNAIDHTHYFTGRSDNFDPLQHSSNPKNARLDPEGIRVSRDGQSVFISDEYGPYIYQFDLMTGKRIKSLALPNNLAVSLLSPQGQVEIDHNSVGRVANKGMEGLAITPDGKMLVGIVQANLEQDKKGSLRIVTFDVNSGVTHEYAYQLTDGSGASEILAVNNHQFLVDERDGNGMGDKPLITDTASEAKVKKLYLIDLEGAQDVTNIAGPNADLSHYAVTKNPIPFLDIVSKLNGAPAHIDKHLIPSKLEGIAFGQDVVIDGVTKHTLYVANDNDFLATIADPLKLPSDTTRSTVPNPNQFYVFTFGDEDLPGFVPQQINAHSPLCSAEH